MVATSMFRINLIVFYSFLVTIACGQIAPSLIESITDPTNKTFYISLGVPNPEGIHFSPNGILDFGADGSVVIFREERYRSLNLMIIDPLNQAGMFHFIDDKGNMLLIVKQMRINNNYLDFHNKNVIVLFENNKGTFEQRKKNISKSYIQGDIRIINGIKQKTLTTKEETSLGLIQPDNAFTTRTKENDKLLILPFDTVAITILDSTTLNGMDIFPVVLQQNHYIPGEVYSFIYTEGDYTMGWDLNLEYMYNTNYTTKLRDFQHLKKIAKRVQELIGKERILFIFADYSTSYVIYFDSTKNLCLVHLEE